MQLELNITKNKYMRVVDESTVCQEETGEIIIPDAQPDVVRIADTYANILLKSKEAEQGRAIIKGILQTTVIYVSKDEGLYRADVPVPFTVTINKPDIMSDCAISALAEVIMADAVISNARKIVVRLNIKARITCYVNTENNICSGISGESVFQKKETVDISCMSEYSEKTFVITDDIMLDDKKACEFDVLSCEHVFKDINYGVSADRIIVRGKLETRLCWIAEDSMIPKMKTWITDFSQILDSAVTELTDAVSVVMMMTGCYCDSDMYSAGADTTSVSIEIHAVAQCGIFENREMEILSDLYTTAVNVESEWEEQSYMAAEQEECKTIKVREKACSADMFEEIVSVRVSFGEVHRENLQYKVNGYILLYGYNKNAEVITVKTGFQVMCECETVSNSISVNAENISTEITGDSLTVSCDVRFMVTHKINRIIRNLKSADLDSDKKPVKMPSAVLYRVIDGDTLWSIAKKYLSSCELIKQVNEIEDETLTAGKVILIPKV